jgi:hypothetical protein
MPPIFWTQKQDIGPSARANHGLAHDSAAWYRDQGLL